MVTATYNSYDIPNIVDKISLSEDEKNITFGCKFVVLAASASALVSACATAEAALTEINKDFSMSFGGSSELSFSHSINTGFLSRPHLTKLETPVALACSRPYHFSVNIQLPFGQSGYNYRREGSFSISYAPSRQRTVSFSCLYTAGGANSALQNYVAGTGGKNWAAGILTALGGTYELISESIHEEMEQKILNASLTYKEIISNQSQASVNVAAIVDPHVSYSVRYAQEIGISGAGYVAIPATTVSISYSCTIDHDQVGTDTSMETVYQDTVKPWLINHVWDMLDLGDYPQSGPHYIVQNEAKSIDPYAYTLSGSLVFIVPKMASLVIALTENININDDEGIVAEKIWDGKQYTHATWGIGKTKSMTRSISITKLDSPPTEPPDYPDESPGKWLKRSRSTRKEVKEFGSGTAVSGTNIVKKNVYFYGFNDQYIYVEPFASLG